MGVVVGLAGPDGTLVELDALVRGAAEDHGAHAAVADGQGVGPENGGLVVPEGEGGWLGDRGGPRGKNGERHYSQFFHKKKKGGGVSPPFKCTSKD